ncbi:universal stress protein [Pontibacter harenae]|uniref:universal stress protein n=1 Tax=Pontibacter harenae TaxID=2894083 RepID=UPI001E46E98B|nr:universal stress protein [Pontibacter harenae]MCC9167554.1 universal stress protein [Pontibacter harenae]
MKTILVPVDYSENSKNALHYALEIAKIAGADVKLFHAFFPIMSPPAAYEVMNVIQALEEGRQKELELFADEAIKAFAVKADIGDVKITCVAKMGGIYELILQAIEKYKADLVVMGMQEGEAVSQALFGSTTISVMQESQVPILAVPKGVPFRSFSSAVFAADLQNYQIMRICTCYEIS